MEELSYPPKQVLRRFGVAAARAGAHRVRAWQRQQPAQPAQSSGRARSERAATGDAAVRSAAARGGPRPEQRIRYRSSRTARDRRNRMAGSKAFARRPAAWVVRRQHRRSRRTRGRRRPSRARLRSRLARWPAGPRRRFPGARPRADAEVLALNRRALGPLTDQSELVVVPGATHLFEERGALERGTQLAGNWFIAHLPGGAASRPRSSEGRSA